jgi:hypothetical protein
VYSLDVTHCRFADLDESIKEDVKFLKDSPLVDGGAISGYKVRYPLDMELTSSMT